MSLVSFSQGSRLVGSIALIFAAGFAQAQQPQTTKKTPRESVLYNFQGGADGANPHAGVIFGSDGALYGTTMRGGTFGTSAGSGMVFKLTSKGQKWTRTVLHSFSSAPDGVNPFAGVIFDSSGALYGTTSQGGNSFLGTVYRLTPRARARTPPTNGGTLWTETVLHTFTGGADGANPSDGALIIDGNGALYGTTINGGNPANSGNGTVYKLTPPTNGGTVWNETILYSFTDGADGRFGSCSLIFDSSGALYGTTQGGSQNDGTVYKLTPPTSGTVWNFTVLYTFARVTNYGGPDGALPPAAPLVFDGSGALYGTTRAGGSGPGTVYKLTPPATGTPPGTPWVETVLYYFMGGADGSSPDGGVILGNDGALYGTTSQGGAGWGSVYKLTPPTSGTIWAKTVLHNFSSAPDGNFSYSGLIFDRHGTMYGTTADGGAGTTPYNGTVFQVIQ
jgi:uncharacterized repeat protein (TIGR03803 family)